MFHWAELVKCSSHFQFSYRNEMKNINGDSLMSESRVEFQPNTIQPIMYRIFVNDYVCIQILATF